MGQARNRFVVCVRSDGAEDLEFRKVYRVLPDESASARGHLRVIDESGEDYLYPEEWFVPIEVSEDSERVLSSESPEPTGRTS